MITLLELFHWSQLLQPQFYIEHGGLWLLLFVVFAETGLFFGFFLPGDSLLFVAGIYSAPLVSQIFVTDSEWLNLGILFAFISVAGILGNYVGYYIGKKVGPAMYEWKDNLLFKKKYLVQAHEFYEKHGGRAIVIARFIPIVRTFAPIVAGIVAMDKKKFVYFNVVGCEYVMRWPFFTSLDFKSISIRFKKSFRGHCIRYSIGYHLACHYKCYFASFS
jgi:membrane-associated protein